MSSIYGKGPRGKATRLHSLVVRARGACERCGRTETLQAAHIISRRFAATRTDETNAWCLCAGCHRRLTEHPDEHMHFVAQTIGMDQFDVMKAKALSGVHAKPAFWEAEVERLTALLENWEQA